MMTSVQRSVSRSDSARWSPTPSWHAGLSPSHSVTGIVFQSRFSYRDDLNGAQAQTENCSLKLSDESLTRMGET
jgi:hypothetical protein